MIREPLWLLLDVSGYLHVTSRAAGNSRLCFSSAFAAQHRLRSQILINMPRKLPWLQDKSSSIPPRVPEKRVSEKKGGQKLQVANSKSDNDSVLTKTSPQAG